MAESTSAAASPRDKYALKLADLQKHVPFIQAMIGHLKGAEDKSREGQLAKMESLHSMITDTQRKWKYEILLKCEEVIVKLKSRMKSNILTNSRDGDKNKSNKKEDRKQPGEESKDVKKRSKSKDGRIEIKSPESSPSNAKKRIKTKELRFEADESPLKAKVVPSKICKIKELPSKTKPSKEDIIREIRDIQDNNESDEGEIVSDDMDDDWQERLEYFSKATHSNRRRYGTYSPAESSRLNIILPLLLEAIKGTSPVDNSRPSHPHRFDHHHHQQPSGSGTSRHHPPDRYGHDRGKEKFRYNDFGRFENRNLSPAIGGFARWKAERNWKKDRFESKAKKKLQHAADKKAYVVTTFKRRAHKKNLASKERQQYEDVSGGELEAEEEEEEAEEEEEDISLDEVSNSSTLVTEEKEDGECEDEEDDKLVIDMSKCSDRKDDLKFAPENRVKIERTFSDDSSTSLIIGERRPFLELKRTKSNVKSRLGFRNYEIPRVNFETRKIPGTERSEFPKVDVRTSSGIEDTKPTLPSSESLTTILHSLQSIKSESAPEIDAPVREPMSSRKEGFSLPSKIDISEKTMSKADMSAIIEEVKRLIAAEDMRVKSEKSKFSNEEGSILDPISKDKLEDPQSNLPPAMKSQIVALDKGKTEPKSNNLVPIKRLKSVPMTREVFETTSVPVKRLKVETPPSTRINLHLLHGKSAPNKILWDDGGKPKASSDLDLPPRTTPFLENFQSKAYRGTTPEHPLPNKTYANELPSDTKSLVQVARLASGTPKMEATTFKTTRSKTGRKLMPDGICNNEPMMGGKSLETFVAPIDGSKSEAPGSFGSGQKSIYDDLTPNDIRKNESTKSEQISIKNTTPSKIGPKEPVISKLIASTSVSSKSKIDEATSSEIYQDKSLQGPVSKDLRIKKPPVEATLVTSKIEIDRATSSDINQNKSSQKLTSKDFLVKKPASSTIFLRPKSETDKPTSSEIYQDKSSQKLTSTVKKPIDSTSHLAPKFETDRATFSEISQNKSPQKLASKDPRVKKSVEAVLIASKSEIDKAPSSGICQDISSQKLGCKDSLVRKPAASTILLGFKPEIDKTTSSEIHQDKSSQKLTPRDSTAKKPVEPIIPLRPKFQTGKATSSQINQNESSQKLTPKDSIVRKPVGSTIPLGPKLQTEKVISSEINQNESSQKLTSKDCMVKKPVESTNLLRLKAETSKVTSSETCQDKSLERSACKDPRIKKTPVEATLITFKSEIDKTTSSEIHEDKSSQQLTFKDSTVKKPVESITFLEPKSEIDKPTSTEICQEKSSQKLVSKDSTVMKHVESIVLLGAKSEIDKATSSETCQNKFSPKITPEDSTAKKSVESTILLVAKSETDKATSSELYQDKSSQKLISKASTIVKICTNEPVREKTSNLSVRAEKTVPINKINRQSILKDFKPNKISTDDLPKEKKSTRISSKSCGKSRGERTLPVELDQNKIEQNSTPKTLLTNEPAEQEELGQKFKVDKKLLTEVDQGKIEKKPTSTICIDEPAKRKRPSQTTLDLCDKSKGADQNIVEQKQTASDLPPNNICTNEPVKEKEFTQATLDSCDKPKEVDHSKVEQRPTFRDPPPNKICIDESEKEKGLVHTILGLAHTILGLRDKTKEVNQNKVEQKLTSKDPRPNKTYIDDSTKQRRPAQTHVSFRDNSKEVDQTKVEQNPTSRDPPPSKICIDKSSKQKKSAQTNLSLRDSYKEVEQKPTSKDPRANKTCIDELSKQKRSAQSTLGLHDNSKEVDQTKVEQKSTSRDPPANTAGIDESAKQNRSDQTTLDLRDNSKEVEQKPTSGDPPLSKICIDESAKLRKSAQATLDLHNKSKLEQKPSKDPPPNKIFTGDVAKQKRPTQGTLDSCDKSKEVGQNKIGQKTIEKKQENFQNTNVEKLALVSIESDLKMGRVQETSVPLDSKATRAVKSESEKERKLLERAKLKVETPPPHAEVRETSEVEVKSKKSVPSVKEEAINVQKSVLKASAKDKKSKTEEIIPPVTGQVPKLVAVEDQLNKTNLAKNKIQDGVTIEKKTKDRPETYTKYDRMYSSLAKMGASAPSIETLYSEESTTKSFKIPKRQIQAPPPPPLKPTEPPSVEVERSNSKGFRRIVPVESLESKEEGAVVVKAKNSNKKRKRKVGKSARITDDSDEEPDAQNETIQKQERDKDGGGKERKLPSDDGKSKKAEVENREKDKPQVAADEVEVEINSKPVSVDKEEPSSSGTSKTVEVKEASAIPSSSKEEAKESEKSAVEEESKDQPHNSTDLLEFILKNYKQIKKIFKNDDSSDDESHSRKRRKKKKKHKRRHSSSSSEDESVKDKQSKLGVLARKERSATPSDKEVAKKKYEAKPPRPSDVPAKELPATSTDKEVPKRKQEAKPSSAKELPATSADKEVPKRKQEAKPSSAKELPATSSDKEVPKRKREAKPSSAKILPATSSDKEVPKRKQEAKPSSAKVLPVTSADKEVGKKKPSQESKPRRNELDILHEDIKDMWMSGDIISATGRRACTVNKEQLPITPKVTTRSETFDKMIEKAAGLRVRLKREDLHGLLSKIKNRQGHLGGNDTTKEVNERETSPLPSHPKKRRRRPCPKSVRKYVQDDREVTPVKERGKSDEVIENEISNRMQLRSGSPPRKLRRRPCPKSAIKYIEDDREVVAREGTPVREDDADEREARPSSPPRKRKRTDSARSNHTPIEGNPECSLHSEDGASGNVAFKNRRSSSVFGLHDKKYYVQKDQLFCLLCNYIGKRISYHYKIMHKEHEVLSSRLSSRITALLIADSKRREYEKIELENGLKRKHNFVCPFCLMNILDFTANFHHHLTSHTSEFNYKCEQCDYECLEIKSMRRHSRKHHDGAVKFTTEAPPPNSNVVFGFVCLECHYLQISKGKLDSHVQVYHANKAEIQKINLNFSGLDDEAVGQDVDVDVEADVDVDVEADVDVDVEADVDVDVEADVDVDVEADVDVDVEAGVNVDVEPDVEVEAVEKIDDATHAGKEVIDTDVQVKIEPSILSDVKLESESNQTDANRSTSAPPMTPIKIEAVPIQDDATNDNRRDETGLNSQNVWDDVTAQTVQWTIDQSDLIASETELPERPAPKSKPSRLFVSENEERGGAMSENAPTSSRSSPSSPLTSSAVVQTKSTPISNIINRLQDNLQPGSSTEQTKEAAKIGGGPIVLNKMLNKDETIPSLIYYTKLLGNGKASPVGDPPLSIEHPIPNKTYKPAKKITVKVVSIEQNSETNDDRPPPLSHYKDLQTKRRADAVLHVGPIKLLRSECGTIFYACFVARCIFCSDKEEVFAQHCLTTHELVTGNWWCQPCWTTLRRFTLHELFVHVNQLHAPTLERKPKVAKRSVADSRSGNQSASTSAMSSLENLVNGGSNVLESKHKSVASDAKPSSKESGISPFPSNREIQPLLDELFDLTASSPEDNAAISASEPYRTLDGAAPLTSIIPIDGAATSANPLLPSLPNYREYHPKRTSALSVVETIDVDSLPDVRTQPSAMNAESLNTPIRKEYIRTVPLSKLMEDDTSATAVAQVPPDHPVQGQNVTMPLSSAYVGYSYKCPVFNCFFSSDNQHDFAVHVFRHPNCYVSCLHCRSLIQLSLYTQHLTHTHVGHQYACPYCPYRASCGAYVRAHMETEHKLTAEVPLPVQSVLPAGPHGFTPYPTIPDLVKPYICLHPEYEMETIFSKTFLSYRRMMLARKRVFRCGYCSLNLPGLNHFVKHGLHPIHCRYCPFGTQGLECAIRHLAENHSSLPFCLLLRIDRFTKKDQAANKDEYWRLLIASEKMIMSKYSYSDESAENKILPNRINKLLQSLQRRSQPKNVNETSIAIDEDIISDQSTPSTSKENVTVLRLNNEDSSNDDYTIDAEEHDAYSITESENTVADYTDGTVYPSCNICGVLLLKIACPHLKVIKTDVQTEYITGKVNTSRIIRSNSQEVVEKSRLVAEGIVQPHYVKDGRFMCGGTHCKRIFDDAHNLRTHLQHVHSSDVVYSCHHCTVVFNFRILEFDVDMLVKHASLHEQTIYRCKYCYFVDNVEENMYLHLFEMHPASRVRYFRTTRDEGDDVNLLLDFSRHTAQDDSTSVAQIDEIEAPASSNTQDLNDREEHEMADVGTTDMYLLRVVVSDTTEELNAKKGFILPHNLYRGKELELACPNCPFTTKRALLLHNHLMDKADVIKRQYLHEKAYDKRLIAFIHEVIRYQVRIWNYVIDTARGRQRECRFCPEMCLTFMATACESKHLVGWSSCDAFNPLQINHPDDVPPDMIASVQSTVIRPVNDENEDLFLLEIMTYADLEVPERPPIDVWPKRCAYCERTGTYRNLAIHHLIKHHCKKVLGFTFACGDCATHFDTVQSFQTHNATEHGSRAMASANFVGIASDECDTCGKKFRNRDLFDLHVKTHSSPYKCKYCDHSTYNRRLLRKHHVDRHNDETFEFLYDFLSAPFPRKEKL